MFSPARNDRISTTQKNRGIALLVMLGIILIAFTASIIGRLSINSIEQKNNTKTVAALVQARDAIMGFALTQTSNPQPPGTLPCPDTDGDGMSNTAPVGGCVSLQGLVPFVTLGLAVTVGGIITPPQPPLWYVIPIGYGGNAVAAFIPRNSSRTSALLLNGQPMAFIVIAPGKPLGGQNPITTPLSPAINFIEPPNGVNPYTNYNDLADATHNDKLLGMPVGTFWTTVEGRVLAEVRDLLNTYNTNCHIYPWAVPYAPSVSNNSVVNTFEGRVPLGVALPSGWGTACPAPYVASNAATALPLWLTPHWGNMLYYKICPPNLQSPPAPAIANCLDLNGDGVFNDARVIVMAPGIALGATVPSQIPRVPGTIKNYFEGTNNVSGDNNFTQLRPLNHTATFNDLIFIVP